ncbi:MAG: aspartate/glutamate racemase family protein [Alphaproteobacteria bacterium]
MRFWYQSVTREGSFPTYRATLGRLLDAAAGPDVELDVPGIRRQGGTGDPYRSRAFLETVEILENVHRAQEEGYDAFLIGNLFDPGLREAREIADIPVLSLGESVLQTAETMGETIGFVSINKKFEPRLQDVLVRRRMADKVAGMSSMQVPSMADLEAAGADGAATAELCARFMKAAEATVDAGAEVVIAAGGVVMAIVADQGLHRTPSGAPIVNGVAALVQQAKAAVTLRRLMGGVYTSPRLTYAKPSQPEIAGFRKAYGQRVYPGVPE